MLRDRIGREPYGINFTVKLINAAGVFHFPSRVLEWSQHFCAVCRATFRSASAWSVHAFRKHGRVTPSRLVAQGKSCTSCGKLYRDHVGLINHLRYNAECYWKLRQADIDVMIQPALNSRVELDSRTDLRCPVLQLPGPLPAPPAFGAIPPTADQQDLLDHWTVILREWYHDPTVSVAEVREALRVATLYTFLPGYEIQWLASQWRVILLQDGATTLEDTFDAALKDYLDRFTVQWLLQDASQPAVQISDPDEVFEHWSMIDPLQCPIPRPIRYHQVVIAHLFSGRRRPGDFQSYAESARLPDGLSCLAISVDIIFSVTWGRETLELFLHAIHCGIILCMLAGPPCESWSIARLRGGVHDDGPRPVKIGRAHV